MHNKTLSTACSTCILLVLLLVPACTENHKTVRETPIIEIVNDEIMTHFPGGLYYMDDYIVWNDPFAKDYFLHVLDAQSGTELGVMGACGQGPQEFVSAMTSDLIWNNLIFVVDINGKNKGYMSVNNLIAQKEPFVSLQENDASIRESGYPIRLDDEVYMGDADEGAEQPYTLYVGGKTSLFGHYPVAKEKIRLYTIFTYHPDKKILVGACTDTKYLSAYRLKDDQFELLWEIRTDAAYDKKGDHLFFTDKKRGSYGICLTKDYIVTIERDYETDFTDESTVGRDLNKLPKTLFVYDYKGNLLKILDARIPFGRIAGDLQSNTIYAIVANPDFMLIRINM